MITRAVIPAAGYGTRMLPAAKSVPKELLPVLDRPTIQYVVEEAALAGATDILLVISRDKKALEDHFDRAPELEARLAAANKSALLDSINRLMARVRIHSVRQAEQKGLGHAVLQAREHVCDQPFLCLLGDAIFSAPPPRPAADNRSTPSDLGDAGFELPSSQLVRAFERFRTPIIALEQVPAEKVDRYGIVGGAEIAPGILRIDTLVEKPARDAAPSRLAIAARYVLTPDIFSCLDRTPPGKGGEIQLTDALQLLLSRGPIHGVVVSARRHDIGNPLDWLRTNIILASQQPDLWNALMPLLQDLLAQTPPGR